MKKDISEKLVCNTIISFKDEKGLTEKIDSKFKTICSIKKIGDNVLVEGIIEIYGYQINNGFFDVINLQYYPENHPYLKEGTISSYSEEKIKKLR